MSFYVKRGRMKGKPLFCIIYFPQCVKRDLHYPKETFERDREKRPSKGKGKEKHKMKGKREINDAKER